MESSQPSSPLRFQLCTSCGRTPQSDGDLPFIDQQDIEGFRRDKGRISQCKYCGHPFLEYDMGYEFYGQKEEFEVTDWIPLTEDEYESDLRLNFQKIVTTRDHLYKRRDGSFAWRRLEEGRMVLDSYSEDSRPGYALDELSERAARKGTGWMPNWDEMDGDARWEYMDFLENIAAEVKFLPPEEIVSRRTRVLEGEAAIEFLRDHQKTEEDILEAIKSERSLSEESPMTLEQYYKEQFPRDIQTVMEHRGHSHGEEGAYISIQLLKRENILQHVTEEDYPLFFSFLALTVMLDELAYTHFREEYTLFHAATMYPKVEYGITGHHADPWYILRPLAKGKAAERLFRRCAEIFLRERREFFRRETIPSMTWEHIQQAIEDDPDIGRGIYGSVFKDALRRICMEETRPPRPPMTPEQQERARRVLQPLGNALIRYKECLEQMLAKLREPDEKKHR